MNEKVVVTLLAVIILVALFLASPRGRAFLEQSKLKDKLSIIGNFFKSLSGKFSSVKNNEGTKIEIHLSGVNPVYMNDQQLSLDDSSFAITLKPETASLESMTLSFKDNIQLSSSTFKGKITYSQGKISLEGKANDLWLGNVGMNKTDVTFSITGTPVSYKIENAKKDYLSFKEISGSLSWAGLKTPALLEKDRLELFDFSGSIEERNGLIYINGQVSYMKLNNVPIGIFK
jgi:hypothetical protein